jgi:hypothetical protein
MIVHQNDIKNLKMQIKFENKEICHYLMISYVKAIVEI